MHSYRFPLLLLIGISLSAQAPEPKKAPPTPAPATPAPTTPAPATPAPATQALDKVILTVGSETMTVGEFQAFVDALPEQVQGAARGPQKRQVVDQLVSMKTLSQEARKRKLDQTPQFRKQLAFQADNLLAGLLFRELTANVTISDADARKYYDEHKNELDRVKARHILIRMKGSKVPAGAKKELSDEEALEKAKSLRARLAAGEDFATLAKAESDDTGSGANGGDLGTFGRGQMVPAFDQTAFSLPVGQLSEPIKTDFGYHLIQVDKHLTFEEIRPDLEKKLRPELGKQAMDKLRNDTIVKIDESYFGPAK